MNKSRTTCKGYEFIPQLSVRITADNYDQYLDEFSKALATEVRMLLGEVGKLREERRSIQQYALILNQILVVDDLCLVNLDS